MKGKSDQNTYTDSLEQNEDIFSLDAVDITNQQIRKTSAKTDLNIFDEIYEAILENRIPPGSHLSQDELGRIFGVSKTIIRPILQQLVQRKLVVIIKNRGAFVAQPSFKEVTDTNNARKLVEVGIVRYLVHHITPAQIKELQKLMEKEKNIRDVHNFSHRSHVTGMFHMAMAKCTENEVVVDMLQNLIARDNLSVALYQKPKIAWTCSVNDHGELLQHIIDGEEEQAVEAVKEHIESILKSLSMEDEDNKNQILRNAFVHLG